MARGLVSAPDMSLFKEPVGMLGSDLSAIVLDFGVFSLKNGI
jgi:hypothetical protein